MPTPMAKEWVPANVNFIWVKEGLVKSVAESGLQVDLNVKVTRFLLEPRGNLQSEHWEKLLPGARYKFDYMTGNHFQITQPPHVSHKAAVMPAVANIVSSLITSVAYFARSRRPRCKPVFYLLV